MDLLHALNWRYAVREFSPRNLSPKTLNTLLEATRLAPSAYGLQPYRLIVIGNPHQRTPLLPYSMGQNKVVESSHLVVFASHTDINEAFIDNHIADLSAQRSIPLERQQQLFDQYTKLLITQQSPEERQRWAVEQTYLALGTFLASAAMMNIDCCPMTGFESEGYDKVLGLTEQGLTATALCALGERHPNDSHAHLPKVRRDLNDLIQFID